MVIIVIAAGDLHGSAVLTRAILTERRTGVTNMAPN